MRAWLAALPPLARRTRRPWRAPAARPSVSSRRACRTSRPGRAGRPGLAGWARGSVAAALAGRPWGEADRGHSTEILDLFPEHVALLLGALEVAPQLVQLQRYRDEQAQDQQHRPGEHGYAGQAGHAGA
ncbi:hypothetical protein [Nonomuraea sp. NPDC049646]|uniref:hypothetical protein n=1 Tax=unclassified Nonomuraea TaxID=2593643 RepID=UPI0037976019